MYTLIFIALFASAYCAPPTKTTKAPKTPKTTATTTTIPIITTTDSSGTTVNCPSGWFHYESSCYWFSRYEDRKAYAAAKIACGTLNSILFVSDSKAEFEAVMQHATRAQWTWIGITGDSVHPGDAKYFKWETNGGENLSSLPWLNTVAPAHGHMASANCVSYYGALTEDASYVHWYPCDMAPNRYYICERNGTATAHP